MKFSIVIVFVFMVIPATETEFSYPSGKNSRGWTGTCVSGEEQSPINLKDTSECTFPKIRFEGYETKLPSARALNNGHSVKVEVPSGKSISSGGLENTYNLIQFHFHWGSNDRKGSEHEVKGHRFPLEAHFVHQNSQGKFAVVGVLFKLKKSGNSELNKIVKVLGNIKQSGDETTVSNIKINKLLPANRNYYRYTGSFTTPGCDEGVTWSVMKQKVAVSRGQLTKFRQLKTHHDGKLVPLENNYREIQPINKRTIYNC